MNKTKKIKSDAVTHYAETIVVNTELTVLPTPNETVTAAELEQEDGTLQDLEKNKVGKL